jgi:hypothetical protein
MSNQICRQRPRAVAVNYMARLSFGTGPPVCNTQNSRDQKHPPTANIIDTNRYVHMAPLPLPLATRPHTARTLLHPREMIDAGLCETPLLTDWKCLSIYCSNRALQVRADCTTPVFGPGQPAVSRFPLCSSEGSRHRSSHGQFHLTPQDLSSHMYVKCKTLSTRGSPSSHESR